MDTAPDVGTSTTKDRVVIGLVGPTLDAGRSSSRWRKYLARFDLTFWELWAPATDDV